MGLHQIAKDFIQSTSKKPTASVVQCLHGFVQSKRQIQSRPTTKKNGGQQSPKNVVAKNDERVPQGVFQFKKNGAGTVHREIAVGMALTHVSKKQRSTVDSMRVAKACGQGTVHIAKNKHSDQCSLVHRKIDSLLVCCVVYCLVYCWMYYGCTVGCTIGVLLVYYGCTMDVLLGVLWMFYGCTLVLNNPSFSSFH